MTAVTDHALVQSAVNFLKRGEGQPPDSSQLVDALQSLEKQNKQQKQRYHYEQLIGCWRLGFVSGTRKTRPRPGATPIKQPGKGRFLPEFIQVSITYTADSSTDNGSAETDPTTVGTVCNCVTLGPAQLQLSGPTQFWPKTNSLGFDFVHLQGKVGSWTLYDAPVRGGKESAMTFKDKGLKEQAFFTFFWVEEDCLAARGKGGGLALWTRA